MYLEPGIEERDPQIAPRGFKREMSADSYMLASMIVIAVVVFLAWKFAGCLVRKKPITQAFEVTGGKGESFYNSDNERFRMQVTTASLKSGSPTESIPMRTFTIQAAVKGGGGKTSEAGTSPTPATSGALERTLRETASLRKRSAAGKESSLQRARSAENVATQPHPSAAARAATIANLPAATKR